MNFGWVPITTGRIDLFGSGGGPDVDVVMGRVPALSVSSQNTCAPNADAILREQISGVMVSGRRHSSLCHQLMYNWWLEYTAARATGVGNK